MDFRTVNTYIEDKKKYLVTKNNPEQCLIGVQIKIQKMKIMKHDITALRGEKRKYEIREIIANN